MILLPFLPVVLVGRLVLLGVKTVGRKLAKGKAR